MFVSILLGTVAGITMDIDDDEGFQRDSGHLGQGASDQGHHLVYLLVALGQVRPHKPTGDGLQGKISTSYSPFLLGIYMYTLEYTLNFTGKLVHFKEF